jgi:hypothetical protein
MEQTIAYRFGPNDYIALLRASRSIGPLGRLGRWGRAAVFGVLIGGMVIVFSYDTLLAAPGLVLVAATMVFALVTAVAPLGEYLAERLMARWLFPRYSFANKELTLELGEQDIRSRMEGSEGRISWRSIIRVIETKDGLFLALSRAELIQLPRRALPSAAAFAELAGEVRSKVAASIAGP